MGEAITAFGPDVGAVGLLALVVILILTGKLIPKASVDARILDKDTQLVAKDQALAAADTLVAKQTDTIHEQAETIRDLVPAARVGIRVGESVQSMGEAAAAMIQGPGNGV